MSPSLPDHQLPAIIPAKRPRRKQLRRALKHLQPTRLPKPQLDPEFLSFQLYVKVPFVLLYVLACLEYWLSPGGTLRAYLKVNLFFAVLICIPLFVLLPLLTSALASLDLASDHVLAVVQKLSLSAETAITSALFVTVGFFLLRLLMTGSWVLLLLLPALATGWWHGWLPF